MKKEKKRERLNRVKTELILNYEDYPIVNRDTTSKDSAMHFCLFPVYTLSYVST